MNRKGMTLIELLAVVGILALLILLAIPNALRAFRNAKKENFVTDAQTIFKTAVSQVQADHPRRNDIVIYCRVDGEVCQGSDRFETLDLTGNTEIDYFVAIDKTNRVEYFVVSNGEFQYAGGSVYKVSHRSGGVDPVTGKNIYIPTSIKKIIEGMEDYTIITTDNITETAEIDDINRIDIAHLAENYEEEIYGITNKTIPLGQMNERVFFLDVNVIINGVKYEKGADMKKYIRNNVYFNGHLVDKDVDDYWSMQVAGTNYRVEYRGINGYECYGTAAHNERGIITSPTYVDVYCKK